MMKLFILFKYISCTSIGNPNALYDHKGMYLENIFGFGILLEN